MLAPSLVLQRAGLLVLDIPLPGLSNVPLPAAVSSWDTCFVDLRGTAPAPVLLPMLLFPLLPWVPVFAPSAPSSLPVTEARPPASTGLPQLVLVDSSAVQAVLLLLDLLLLPALLVLLASLDVRIPPGGPAQREVAVLALEAAAHYATGLEHERLEVARRGWADKAVVVLPVAP